jgi:hypothetical protein
MVQLRQILGHSVGIACKIWQRLTISTSGSARPEPPTKGVIAMWFRLGRSVSAITLTTAMLLSFQVGTAHAHPLFVGTWVAQNPAGTLMKYEFGPGEYQGNWVWRGPLTFYVADQVVSTGRYELGLVNGLVGGVTLYDGNGLANSVGTVHLGNRILNFKNVEFRR